MVEFTIIIATNITTSTSPRNHHKSDKSNSRICYTITTTPPQDHHKTTTNPPQHLVNLTTWESPQAVVFLVVFSPWWNSLHILFTVAEVAIQTLCSVGLMDVCFVGGVACALYRNTHHPNVHSLICPFTCIVSFFSCELVQNLDILILNAPYDQETIKRMLTVANPAFYTVASKTIGATYRVLWYNLWGWSLTLHFDLIKVDILLPGIMDIPSFSANHINTNNSCQLPAAPFSIVLLLSSRHGLGITLLSKPTWISNSTLMQAIWRY